MVTAYDYPSGRLADAAGVDLILVGDSAAMTVLGPRLDRSRDDGGDARCSPARSRAGPQRPLVVADMPFGSYQVSDEEAVRNAIRFVKEAGADAVKLEGAGPSLSRVAAIVGAGIPVMGHIGLTPQSATMLGGFKAQGKTAEKARAAPGGRARARGGRLLLARPRGGAGRGRRADHGRRCRSRPSGSAPGRPATARCSSSTTCSASTSGVPPRFAKRYAEIGAEIRERARALRRRRALRRLPEEAHTYAMPEEELAAFLSAPTPRARTET